MLLYIADRWIENIKQRRTDLKIGNRALLCETKLELPGISRLRKTRLCIFEKCTVLREIFLSLSIAYYNRTFSTMSEEERYAVPVPNDEVSGKHGSNHCKHCVEQKPIDTKAILHRRKSRTKREKQMCTS